MDMLIISRIMLNVRVFINTKRQKYISNDIPRAKSLGRLQLWRLCFPTPLFCPTFSFSFPDGGRQTAIETGYPSRDKRVRTRSRERANKQRRQRFSHELFPFRDSKRWRFPCSRRRCTKRVTVSTSSRFPATRHP